jgi:hypothetical protein
MSTTLTEAIQEAVEAILKCGIALALILFILWITWIIFSNSSVKDNQPDKHDEDDF